jgi:hypothetical protein
VKPPEQRQFTVVGVAVRVLTCIDVNFTVR